VSWEDLDSEQIMSLVERYPDRIDDRMARAAAGVKETLAPYYAIEDQVWERIRERPEFAEYETLDAYVEAMEAELIRAGASQMEIIQRLERLPVLSAVDSAVRRLRERYRRANPEVDRVLVRWYGARPVTREAMAI
jgi:H2-forming N5,N10-methylenetetrahydromethanopterin dehydrogenase-like enzyme